MDIQKISIELDYIPNDKISQFSFDTLDSLGKLARREAGSREVNESILNKYLCPTWGTLGAVGGLAICSLKNLSKSFPWSSAVPLPNDL